MSTMGNQLDGLPQLLTVEAIAKLLHVSVRTVWRLRRDAALPPPLKIGGGLRWRMSDVRTWIEQGCPEQEKPIVVK